MRRIAVLLTMLAVCGCQSRSAYRPDLHPPLNFTYDVELIKGEHERGGGHGVAIYRGQKYVKTRMDGLITLNGRDYGKVGEGQFLQVTADGQVSVDGQPRQPQ